MIITNLKKILKFLYRCDNNIDQKGLLQLLKNNKDAILVDVRSSQEYEEGHINNAINIPVYEIEKTAETVLPNKEATIITYCSMGVRSNKAAKILKKMGYKNVYAVNEGII